MDAGRFDTTRRDFLKLAALTGIATMPATSAVAEASDDGRPGPPRIPGGATFHRLSNPLSELRDGEWTEYLVIGSGYGGAIPAARLASRIGRGVRSVTVIERGKEWLPGEFPQTFSGLVRNARTPLNPHGLYAFSLNREIDVFSGAGLGGTSLVNAGVVIEPEAELFARERWPREIQDEYASGALARYYDRARATLQPESYGSGPVPRKAQALREECRDLGARFELLEIATNLSRPDGALNAAGVAQNQCRRCGDCITGCNFGAKNTLNLNYLPMAKRAGARIFTQVTVDWIERVASGPGRYRVHYEIRDDDCRRSRGSIRADHVIVAAGALGSTRILLRSKQMGLEMSDALGTRFSGNGDFLGMSYNGRRLTDIQGFGTRRGRRAAHPAGPTLDATADYRTGPPEGRFLIEEGAVPSGLVSLLRRTAKIGQLPDSWGAFGRVLEDLVKTSPDGALAHSMLYFCVGHDDSGGRIHVDSDGDAKIRWPRVRELAIFERMERILREHSRSHGGDYLVPSPRYVVGRRLLTVHPLGGCPMGRDPSQGAVDHRGQVFGQPGLYVSDGSIMPYSLGVNPLLTISALAERMSERMLGAAA